MYSELNERTKWVQLDITHTLSMYFNANLGSDFFTTNMKSMNRVWKQMTKKWLYSNQYVWGNVERVQKHPWIAIDINLSFVRFTVCYITDIILFEEKWQERTTASEIQMIQTVQWSSHIKWQWLVCCGRCNNQHSDWECFGSVAKYSNRKTVSTQRVRSNVCFDGLTHQTISFWFMWWNCVRSLS